MKDEDIRLLGQNEELPILSKVKFHPKGIVDFIFAFDVKRLSICDEEGFLEYLGYSRKDQKQNYLQDYLHPDEQKRIVRFIHQIKNYCNSGDINGSICVVLSHNIKTSNGHYLRILNHINIKVVKWTENNTLLFVCWCQDVSAHKFNDDLSFDIKTIGNSIPLQVLTLKKLKSILLDPHLKLTKRELEVLRVWSLNDTSSAAAEQLGIKPATLTVHLRNIRKKTGGVKRTMDSVLIAKRKGWI